jgi:hypothetical protein
VTARAFFCTLLLGIAPCHALSPAKFSSSLLLNFERQGVALTGDARTLLDGHLAGMSQRGECILDVAILAVGSRPRLVADSTGKPLTERERYLAELLARRSITINRLFFVSARESDAAGVGADQVVFEFFGTRVKPGCLVSGT